MATKCCRCVRKLVEILIYLIAGYFCGGCVNDRCTFNFSRIGDFSSADSTNEVECVAR